MVADAGVHTPRDLEGWSVSFATTRSAQGVTPLFAAAAHGHLALVKILVEAGAQTECSLRHALPDGAVKLVKPVDVAAEKGHTQVVEYLQVRRRTRGSTYHCLLMLTCLCHALRALKIWLRVLYLSHEGRNSPRQFHEWTPRSSN